MEEIRTDSERVPWRAEGALIALALMWGTSHVVTKSILATHSPSFYTTTRFGIAAIFFLLFFGAHLRHSSWGEIRRGILLGLCSLFGIAFYVTGLVFTQASKAGFITGLYLVFTPIVALVLFRTRPSRDQVAGLVVALGGFVLLSFPRGQESLNWGDVLVLLAAFSWATHIAATTAFARQGNIRTLAAVQVITVALLALSIHLVLRTAGWETKPNPIDRPFLWQIGYMALLVTFLAALIQTWAQRRVPSAHAALLYALEPVSAALLAYLAFGERLGFSRGVGAVLIVAGVLLSRLEGMSRFLRQRATKSPAGVHSST
jgi:drug/metabolite transporter (DMT)-like permease